MRRSPPTIRAPCMPAGMTDTRRCCSGQRACWRRIAAQDNFEIVIGGKGRHAARPQWGCEALVPACALVMDLQTIVSRPRRHLPALELASGHENPHHGGIDGAVVHPGAPGTHAGRGTAGRWQAVGGRPGGNWFRARRRIDPLRPCSSRRPPTSLTGERLLQIKQAELAALRTRHGNKNQ